MLILLLVVCFILATSLQFKSLCHDTEHFLPFIKKHYDGDTYAHYNKSFSIEESRYNTGL